MSSWAELYEAVNTILSYQNRLTVLQCTSDYPCHYEQVGLNVMLEMKERYKLPVGFSDHTLTNYAAFVAVGLGASVVEKHFTFSRYINGSDAKHSSEPPEVADLVQGIRAIETRLNSSVNKDDLGRFVDMKATLEKSIVALVNLPAGSLITQKMVGLKKPGTGVPAKYLNRVVGKRARQQIQKDTLIQMEDIVDSG